MCLQEKEINFQVLIIIFVLQARQFGIAGRNKPLPSENEYHFE